MSPELRQKIKAIARAVISIPNLPKYTRTTLPKEAAAPGIYVLSEGAEIQYVGRANNIRDRVQQYGRASSGGNAAPFAFRLAKQALGLGPATYTKNGSRAQLEEDLRFKEAFAAAKARISSMEVRFVQEADAVSQAIMEICVAVELRAHHNDFDNH